MESINKQVADIFIKQYSENASKTMSYDSHSSLYLYSRKDPTYVGYSIVWIETRRTHLHSKEYSTNLIGIKRIRPIGKDKIKECFEQMDFNGLDVMVKFNDVYCMTNQLHQFVKKCFRSFELEAINFDRKYKSYVERPSRYSIATKKFPIY